MRLVAYVRVSSSTQIDGYGLDVQRKAIRAWAKANGHRIVAWISDEGVSGTLPAEERPGLSEALSMLRHPPQVDGLIVAKLDRLARKLTVQEACLALIWRDGGHVFATDSGEVLADDPDDPMRTAMRQMAGVFVQLDKATVVKRLRDGRKAKADAGRHAVGVYPYGSRGAGKGRERDAVPNPAEQRAVQRIVELRRAGSSYRQIVEVLQREGYRPRSDTGANGDPVKAWSPMSVRAVAQRAGVA